MKYKVTTTTAGEMKEQSQVILQAYNSRQNSLTFAEWIEEELDVRLFNYNNALDTLNARRDNIYDTLKFGRRQSDGEKVLGGDGIVHDVEGLHNEFYEVSDNLEDRGRSEFAKVMAVYLCAKHKTESRSLLSKIFHPFRTYNEWSVKNQIKERIMHSFDMTERTFDRVVAFSECDLEHTNVGEIAQNGEIVRRVDLVNADEGIEIKEFEEKEKVTDDLLNDNLEFKTSDIEKNYDDDDIVFDKFDNNEFIKEEDVNNIKVDELDDKTKKDMEVIYNCETLFRQGLQEEFRSVETDVVQSREPLNRIDESPELDKSTEDDGLIRINNIRENSKDDIVINRNI